MLADQYRMSWHWAQCQITYSIKNSLQPFISIHPKHSNGISPIMRNMCWTRTVRQSCKPSCFPAWDTPCQQQEAGTMKTTPSQNRETETGLAWKTCRKALGGFDIPSKGLGAKRRDVVEDWALAQAPIFLTRSDDRLSVAVRLNLREQLLAVILKHRFWDNLFAGWGWHKAGSCAKPGRKRRNHSLS